MIRPSCLALFVLVSSAALAADPATSAPPSTGPATSAPFSLAVLQQLAGQVTTMRQTFVQTKRLAILDEPLLAPGLIEIDRTRQAVRWEFTGKSVQVLADGKVRRWGAEGKEETVPGGGDPARSAFAGQMQGFLTGDWSKLEDAFTLAVDPQGAPVLRCTPKSKVIGQFIAGITIRWRDDLSAPAQMVLTSAGGDTTTYDFAPPDVNLALPAARFTGP
jgi:hypothetical protein